jgi:hypothetical protein
MVSSLTQEGAMTTFESWNWEPLIMSANQGTVSSNMDVITEELTARLRLQRFEEETGDRKADPARAEKAGKWLKVRLFQTSRLKQ